MHRVLEGIEKLVHDRRILRALSYIKSLLKSLKRIVIHSSEKVHHLWIEVAGILSRGRAYVLKRSSLFQKWDRWQYRPYVKRSTGILVIFSIISIIVQSNLMAAPDLNDDWDFTTPADYSHSSGIQINNGVAQLKAQNYTSDANTSALYHFDESSGTTAADSSSNSNDAALHGASFTLGNLNNGVTLNGTSDYLQAPSSNSLKLGQQQTIEGWTKFESPFTNTSTDRRYQLVDKGDYQLYYDNETGKLTYELADANANAWSQVGGNDINGGWDANGKLSVNALIKMGSHTYAGIGVTTGDAEVWEWDGSNWTKIGGGPESINNSWSAQTYEGVYSLTTDGSNIYAGLGNGTGDGEVWKWNGSTWS